MEPRRKKRSTVQRERRRNKQRDPRHILHLWCDPVYGVNIPFEFVRTVVSIYKAKIGAKDVDTALKAEFKDVLSAMEELEISLTSFLGGPHAKRTVQILKDIRCFYQLPEMPLTLRRYDLPTVLKDLPILLKTYRGLFISVSGGVRQIAELARLPVSDKKRAQNRALCWLYEAVRKASASDNDAHENIASVVYSDDSNGRGGKEIFDHLRWFQRDHSEEYERIRQYLQKGHYPNSTELGLMIFYGFPPTLAATPRQ